ncbi:hypothetical protein H0H92_003359 [Tricholoma furcatifolium]|nr:hypothetical protein H0H92_003359 [Tricholoma furcatifolium]
MPGASAEHWGARAYTEVPGFFRQSEEIHRTLAVLSPGFGLIDQSPDRWKKFRAEIARLNEIREVPPDVGVSYKVFFFGRHGQGYHNVGEAKYGTKDWDDHWSKLNGDGELVWADPELTPLGETQAMDVQKAWESELTYDIPLPEKIYCSPMTRALKTCELSFDNIVSDQYRRPVVLENCREENGVHTCDKRRTASYISNAFPRFELEPGFSEEDLLWDAEVRETRAHVASRAKEVLDMIFAQDETFISITAHGGIINGFLETIGRPRYPLPPGGVLPVVIKLKAQKLCMSVTEKLLIAQRRNATTLHTDTVSTCEGWGGFGDPLQSQNQAVCTTAGPNWARQLSNAANKTLVNLAVSGATSDQSIVYASPPDFRSQVTSFLTDVAPYSDKVAWNSNNSIFIVTFGSKSFLF